MNRFIRLTTLLMLSLAIGLSGCGGGGGGSTPQNTPSTTTISGVASKGLIDGATATAFILNANGTKGAQLGNAATTLADGSFMIDLGTYTGNVIIEVTGGSYTDEATGVTVINTAKLRVALTDVSGETTANATALTEVAVQVAESNAGGLTASNIEKANTQVSNLVGVNIVETLPADVLGTGASTESADAQAYGVALAGISQMLADGTAADVETAVMQLAADLSDNSTLDTQGAAYASAINTFIAGGNNQTETTASAELVNSVDVSTASPVSSANIASLFAGTWFTTENDDGLRQDGTTDSYPEGECLGGLETITTNADGSWTVQLCDGTTKTLAASEININEASKTVTVFESDGRTVLAYNETTTSIDGQWQKLADDGVTYYENYETWTMAVPTAEQIANGAYTIDMNNRVATSVMSASFCTNGVTGGWTYTFSATGMTLTGSDSFTTDIPGNCTLLPGESISLTHAEVQAVGDIPFNCGSDNICTYADLNGEISGVDGDNRAFTSTYSYSIGTTTLTYVKVATESNGATTTYTEVITIGDAGASAFDETIVGAWSFGNSTGNPGMLVFFSNKSYIHYEEDNTNGCTPGVEYGSYSYDGTTITATSNGDDNGECGLTLPGESTVTANVSVSGNTLSFNFGENVLTRVDGGSGSLVGSWDIGNDAFTPSAIVFYDNGFYIQYQTPGSDLNCAAGGVEYGTYAHSGTTITGNTVKDSNGECGLNSAGPGAFTGTDFSVTGDVLTIIDGVDTYVLDRI